MSRRRKHNMSKIIKLTPEFIEQCRREFDEYISTARIADGKVSFTKTLNYPDRKATLFFEPDAWIKMDALVRNFDDEVAWHGVAFRGDNPNADDYYITDIIVYPQEVTGATVNTDQAEYEQWLMSFDDDVFNNIRMQGHSHVNMGVTPSGVDTTHQEKILEQLDDDMFYIFLIWNKKGDRTIKIYDLAKNVLFETADVNVKIIGENLGIDEFISEAKKMVKKKSYNYGGTYKGPTYIGSASSKETTKPSGAPYNPISQQPTSTSKAPVAPNSASSAGNKKKKESFRDWDASDAADPDDDDDPYGPFGYRDRFFNY